MRIGRAALAIAAGVLAGTTTADAARTPRAYSRSVAAICDGAMLFEGRYTMGTRAGAVAVSRAIRRTGGERLRRIQSLPRPPREAQLAVRWLTVQRRLIAMYAATYLDIWVAIEHARTPHQRAVLPGRLRVLVDRPRPLERRARKLERRLGVPDCTGGIESSTHPSAPPPA